jgi:hypothetical protein
LLAMPRYGAASLDMRSDPIQGGKSTFSLRKNTVSVKKKLTPPVKAGINGSHFPGQKNKA